VLDATRCLSWSTQRRDPVPDDHADALGDRVYGCDICQDVCPWNRGIEKRRGGEPTHGEPVVSLVDWLQRDDDELRRAYDRLFVARNDGRHLKRNALVALGNSGRPEHAVAIEPYLEHEDPTLREHAAWALGRIAERHAA
jgi:epoxyqueuosine reductase